MYPNGTNGANAPTLNGAAFKWTPAAPPTVAEPPSFRAGLFDGLDVDQLIEDVTGRSTTPPTDAMNDMPPQVVQWVYRCIDAALLTGYRIGRNPDLLVFGPRE